MEQHHLVEKKSQPSAHYGSISMVKRMKHHAMLSPSHQPAGDFEPESASLTTNVRFITGGKAYHSRDRISRFLDHSTFGVGLDLFLAIVSLVYVASYIVNTYIPVNDLPTWLWMTELFCASCFTLDYLFRGVYLSDHRIDYILSLNGLVSAIVILPVLPTSFFLKYHTMWYDASYWRFVYPVRFVKCYIETKSILSRCHALMTPMRQFAMLCYLQIVLIIAGAAGIIQIAETSDGKLSVTHMGDWTFFNSFFNSVLVFVTIQTPPADNVLAKVFVGVLVIVLILIVPYQISRILDLGKSFSQYELMVFKPSKTTKHIVLCGDLTPSRIDHFFSEVFHDDHDMVDLNVVVLSEDEPSTSMIALLMDPFFEKRASFLQGSILDVDDAQRAACDCADAIFILSRRCGQEDNQASDHRTLMRVMAAKRLAPHAKIYAQMHLSSNRHLMEDLDVKNILYFSEVMLSLMGQNCVCPGFSTFLYNLTSTSSYDGPESAAYSDNDSWEERYLRGSSLEVYSVPLPSSSVVLGKTFAEVASLAYSQCAGVIVFAVLSRSHEGAMSFSEGKILLNPGNSYSCVGDETVFVIAKDRRAANAVTFMYPCSADKMHTAWTSHRQNNNTTNNKNNNIDIRVMSVGGSVTTDTSSDQHSPGETTRRRSKIVDWQVKLDSDSSVDGQLRRIKSIDDAVVEDVQQLDLTIAPIIVCVLSATSFPNHLEYLLGPLRVKALRQHRPVIIVTSILPSAEIYETFRHFRRVNFVVGNPFHRSTLERAGFEKAFKIVITYGEGEISESGSSELLADASCIALHKAIATFIGPQRAPRIITELINRANVHFISQSLLASEWFPSFDENQQRMLSSTSSMAFARNFFMSPAFASGLTYSTSLCDSLLINQYFNSMIKSILREFIFASWKDKDYLTMPTSPPQASSSTPFGATGSPTSSSIASPHSIKRSSLFAVEVPLDFVGKTFDYVFHYLLSSDGILALGVYRCRPDVTLLAHSGRPAARVELPESERSVPFGYVYVNPFPGDVLTGNDLLYVLSHKQPLWA